MTCLPPCNWYAESQTAKLTWWLSSSIARYAGLLSLPVGALVVSFHNVWTGPATLLTLFGWQQVIKSLIYLRAPRLGLRMLEGTSHDKSWQFVVAGVFFVLIGVVLTVNLLRHHGVV